jgi:peptide methionine sulfoxide reductase msrA/msrB
MKTDEAIFAAGCFWGVQNYFDQVPGVIGTEVGYIGGHVDNPTYEQVCTHQTGHAEATKVMFDPARVSYQTLLKHFFRMHDPTQLNRQGPDVGDNYRSAIFYKNDHQKQQALKIIEELSRSSKYKKPIVTTIEKATTFWLAEQYHQKYTQKTGIGACHISYAPL